ncbi:protein nessun dorma [Cloeon dipterum]|uniref:protein nessun dorma n=1 Tax=Cloeon dipterum TaxID=197152 RepID=UPI00321F7C40
MNRRVETARKNHDERMNEFVGVLNREDCLPGSEVLDEWRFHLELTVKKGGWLAVYKPPAGRNKEYMDFVNELVAVESVEFRNFEGYVCSAGQSDCSSSETGSSSTQTNKVFCVPLEDLYPCTNQPDPEVDGDELANVLDQYRYFRANLWLPWDEEDDNEDWRVAALEPRMQLLYDMEQGLAGCEMCERVRRVFRQAWAAHEDLQSLQDGDPLDSVDGSPVSATTRALDEEGVAIRVMQLHQRLDQLRHEFSRLQNPLIRGLMVRQRQRMMQPRRKGQQPWNRLVWPGGPAEQLAKLVGTASLLAGTDQRFKLYPLLALALEEANAGDFVFLAAGKYSTTGSAGLEAGGTIRGIGEEAAVVSGCEAGDVMLNIECQQQRDETVQFDFVLSNVTLEAYKIEICLLLSAGNVLLENCIIDGGGSHDKDDSVGAMVRANCRLVARNCVFTGFTTGIIAYGGARLELEKCHVKECQYGMQMYKGAELSMKQCVVSECTSHGVYFKWSCDEQENGSTLVAHDFLNTLPGVSVQESDFKAVPLAVQVENVN